MNLRTFAYSLSVCFLLSNSTVVAQNNELSKDQLARLSFSVHLITYDTVGSFQSPLGEAYFQTMLFAYERGIEMPSLSTNGIAAKDMETIQFYATRFNAVKASIPTWDFLLEMESKYLIWKDASLRRTSKYRQ